MKHTTEEAAMEGRSAGIHAGEAEAGIAPSWVFRKQRWKDAFDRAFDEGLALGRVKAGADRVRTRRLT